MTQKIEMLRIDKLDKMGFFAYCRVMDDDGFYSFQSHQDYYDQFGKLTLENGQEFTIIKTSLGIDCDYAFIKLIEPDGFVTPVTTSSMAILE